MAPAETMSCFSPAPRGVTSFDLLTRAGSRAERGSNSARSARSVENREAPFSQHGRLEKLNSSATSAASARSAAGRETPRRPGKAPSVPTAAPGSRPNLTSAPNRSKAGGLPDEAPETNQRSAAAQRDNHLLHCNFRLSQGATCGRPCDKALVASCGHIFCLEHGEEWFQKNSVCPICRRGGIQTAKAVGPSLGSSGVLKLLLGCSPRDIFAAANIAMNLWVDQKAEDVARARQSERRLEEECKQLLGNGQQNLTGLERTCNTLKATTGEQTKQLRESWEEHKRMREKAAKRKEELQQWQQDYQEAMVRSMGIKSRPTPRRAAHRSSQNLDLPPTRGTAPARGSDSQSTPYKQYQRVAGLEERESGKTSTPEERLSTQARAAARMERERTPPPMLWGRRQDVRGDRL